MQIRLDLTLAGSPAHPYDKTAMRREKANVGRFGFACRHAAWLALVLAVIATPALAAKRTWTGLGGDNNWSTPGNWDGGSTAPSDGDDLTFTGTTQQSSVNDFMTSVGNIVIENGGFTLSGDAVTLNGTFGSTGDNEWAISLTLTASGYYIQSLVGTLTISGDIDNDGNDLEIDAYYAIGVNGPVTVTGVISGSGGLTKSGDGRLTLTEDNTYEGKNIIGGGQLTVGKDSSLGTVPASDTVNIELYGGYLDASASFTVNSKRLINITRSGGNTGLSANSGVTLTYANAISAVNSSTSYGLRLDGEGTIALSGNSTYRGGTTIYAGKVIASHSNALGYPNSSIITVNSLSVLELRGGITISRNIDLDYSTLLNGEGDNECSGDIQILKNPSGKSVVSAASGTTLTISSYLWVEAKNTETSPINTLENLYIEGEGDIEISATIDADGTDGGSGYLLGHGDVVMDGSGTLTLSGENSFSGRLIANSGTVSVNSDDSFGIAPDYATAGRIVFNGGSLLATASFTLDSNRGIALFPASSGTTEIEIEPSVTVSYGGVIADYASGVGALTKSGAGTLLLSGANTYKGKTIIAGGTLGATSIKSVSGGASSLGSPVTVANGTIQFSSGDPGDNATLLYSGSGDSTDRVISFGGTGNATITQNGSSGLLRFTSDVTSSHDSQHTLTLNGTGLGELNGVLGNVDTLATSLTKSGTGTWRISSTQTYTGNTTISAGTLQIGIAGTAGALSTSSAITDNSILAFNRTDTVTQGTHFNSVIGGSGAVHQNGSGTLVLNGVNTYSAGTEVNAGTLLVSNSSGSGTGSGTVNVNSGATLGGTGTIGGAMTAKSGGTVAPGASVGTLHIAGNATFQSGSTYVVEIGAGTACDKLDMLGTGALTLGTAVTTLSIGAVNSPGCTIAINIKRSSLTGTYEDTSANELENNSQLFLPPNDDYYIHYVDKTDSDDGYIVLNLSPTSADAVIRADATPNGVVVEYRSTDEAGQNDIILYQNRGGEWVEVGRLPAIGSGSNTYQFFVPGLSAGDLASLMVCDDEGLYHTVNDLQVGGFTVMQARVEQADGAGLTLSWNSVAGRAYDVYRADSLNGTWERVQAIEATQGQTVTVVPLAGTHAGYLQILERE